MRNSEEGHRGWGWARIEVAGSVQVEPTKREEGSALDVQCDTRVACARAAAIESCSIEPAERVDVCHATLPAVCVCVRARARVYVCV